jgi:hypothetical protein
MKSGHFACSSSRSSDTTAGVRDILATTMDALSFVAELVKAISWPVCILVIALLFRRGIAAIFPRLTRLQHRDTIVDFAKQIEGLKSEVAALPIPTSLPKDQRRLIEFRETELRELSSFDPQATVLGAYAILELAAAEALVRHYPELDTKEELLAHTTIAKMLREKEVFGRHEEELFVSLSRIRNTAAHKQDFEMSEESATQYLDIALTLTRLLKERSS